MDVLFEATLPPDGHDTYQVSFENESYLFTPVNSGGSSFRLRREHDEWQHDGGISPVQVANATRVLDDYLLAQH